MLHLFLIKCGLLLFYYDEKIVFLEPESVLVNIQKLKCIVDDQQNLNLYFFKVQLTVI